MYRIELIDNSNYFIEDEKFSSFKKAICDNKRRFVIVQEDLIAIHQIKSVKKIKETYTNDLEKYLDPPTQKTTQSQEYQALKDKMLKALRQKVRRVIINIVI